METGLIGPLAFCAAAFTRAQPSRERQQIIRGRRQRRNRQQNHSETSATPQITSDAPAQRSAVTRSFRTYFASTVSST